MVYSRLKTAILAIFAVTFLLIKLFTGVNTYSSDPTSTLFFKQLHSFKSYFRDLDMANYVVIFNDENGFVGDDVYAFIVSYGWILACAALLIFVLLSKRKLKSVSN
jgi:hypothetical protein